MRQLTVGVVGGTGYTGGELCRLLLGHPYIATIFPTSRTPTEFTDTHPNLRGSGLHFTSVDQLMAAAPDVDLVFFCTPSGEAMRLAGHFVEQGVKVIDLSADFRFRDPQIYHRVYGAEHLAPDLLADATYGVTELHRARVAAADLIANPGCYAITAILAITPLLDGGLVRTDVPIAVHAINGTTGAGTMAKRAIMHAEVSGSLLSYSLEGHRHGPELETQFSRLAERPVVVDLNTAHGDFARGIHLQANMRLAHPVTRDELLSRYIDRYGEDHHKERFVLINTGDKSNIRNDKQYDLYPRLGDVVGSNYCHIGIDVDPDRGIVKIVAVIDNLIKGAAGSAIQNMNVMFGYPEDEGLRSYAL